MSQKFICSQCGHVGQTKNVMKGSIVIELILWLCFLLPGLIYSRWRASTMHKVCVLCNSSSLIPVDSPLGKKALMDQGRTVEEVKTEPNIIINPVVKILVAIIIAIILIPVIKLLYLILF